MKRYQNIPDWLKVLLTQFVLVLLLLAVWQAAHVFGWGQKVVVRSPREVADALTVLHESGVFWQNYWATIKATILGLLISLALGLPLGLFLGLSRIALRVVAPFISAFNATPRIALAPVFIIVFGVAIAAKIAVAVSLVVFIIILNCVAGVSAADPEAVRMMTALGASKRQILAKVVLPAAMPSVLTGIRLGLIYSLLGVIASELIASVDGLGQLIAQAAGNFDLATVYAILLVLMVTAAIFNSGSEYAERSLCRWTPPTPH